jgi:hypothetical protein
MNAIAESIPVATPWRRLREPHVFILMAGLFIVLVLAGFIPSSLAKLEAVRAGARPPLPGALHVHAVLMGAWLVLLLAQSALAAGGRRAAHRLLGFASAAVLVGVVVSGVVLVRVTWDGLWSPAAAAVMPLPVLADARAFVSNILLMQVRALVLFPLCVAWALWLRRRDPAAHQRLMLLGTAIPVVAGLDRLSLMLGWTTLPASPLALELYMLASVVPLLAWDLLRNRQVHFTTVAWLGVNLPLAIATHALWNSGAWLAAAPRVMGVG